MHLIDELLDRRKVLLPSWLVTAKTASSQAPKYRADGGMMAVCGSRFLISGAYEIEQKRINEEKQRPVNRNEA